MGIGDYIRTSDLQQRRVADLIDCGSVIYCGSSTGTGNSYELSPYPIDPDKLLINEYETGARYLFKADKTNTGAATAALYSRPRSPTLLASKNVVKGASGAALVAGDIQAGDYVLLVDDGTDFRVVMIGNSVLLAALALLGTGVVCKTGTNSYAVRTITSSSTSLTVTNGDGVAGAPTLQLDGDLEALGTITGGGMATRLSVNTWATRSLTAPAAGITITNNTGFAGNPTFALANDLAAVEGLSGTGIAVRTGTDTWNTRTLVAGTNITITNPDGVSGDITINATGGGGGLSQAEVLTRNLGA